MYSSSRTPTHRDADTTVQFQDLGFLNGLVKSFEAPGGLVSAAN